MTKIAIMQPYFFPYIGYYSLIHATSRLILFDTPQYDRKGWMSRNRILKPNKDEWQYVKARTIKTSRFSAIKDIFLSPDNVWRHSILAQLEHYKMYAPYFKEVIELVKNVVFSDELTLVGLCKKSLNEICNHLGLSYELPVFSEMNLELPEIKAAGEWALEISKSIGANTYINPPGGREIFDPALFKRNNISLQFLHHNLPEYDQKRPSFIPGLSIIDVLMFNSPEATLAMIADYELLTGDID